MDDSTGKPLNRQGDRKQEKASTHLIAADVLSTDMVSATGKAGINYSI